MSSNIIIGLTGRFGAGSTTTANLLLHRTENDFQYFSLSQYIKNKARNDIPDFDKKNEKEKRVILQDIGDSLRKEDPAFLVNVLKEEIDKFVEGKKVIVDSIRNHQEVKALRDNYSNFFLIAVDASTKNRWKRLNKLYKNDQDQFDLDDQRDAGGEDEPDNGQQVKACMKLADILVNNDRSFDETSDKKGKDPVEEYGQKINRYIKLINNPGSKVPSLDEMHMHQACSVALHSACLKRQVGAIIVRESDKLIKGKYEENKRKVSENHVIATGCNNVPAGAYPCGTSKGSKKCFRDTTKDHYIKKALFCVECGNKLEGKYKKCPKCNRKVIDFPGRLLDLCQSIHAEEATILQAAKLGISINGTTLYTSTFPCLLCAKKIIGSGIRKVVYLEPYPMNESVEMLEKCEILVKRYEGVNSRAYISLFMRKIEI